MRSAENNRCNCHVRVVSVLSVRLSPYKADDSQISPIVLHFSCRLIYGVVSNSSYKASDDSLIAELVKIWIRSQVKR
jgi:hypothetical protein